MGKFVIFFQGFNLVMGYGLIFIMQGGEHGGSFNVWLWKKMGQFSKGPKFGVEMSV